MADVITVDQLIQANSQAAAFLNKWDEFPPTKEDKERLRLYELYGHIYETEHEEVFERAKAFLDSANPKKSAYIPVNICALVSNKGADFLFGDDLIVKSQKPIGEGGEKADLAINAIFDRSMLQPELHAGEISSSRDGGVVLKVRCSNGEGGEEPGAYIECMPSSFFFTIPNPRNVKRCLCAYMAYVSEEENPEDATKPKRTLHREIQWPGYIATDAWEIDKDGKKGKVGDQIGTTEITPTGYDGILMFYVPNQRMVGQFWGRSDYKAIMALQDELNIAVSMLGMVLNKYSEPLMAVPQGAMEDGEDVIREQLLTDPKLGDLTPEDVYRRLAMLVAQRDKNILPVDATVFEPKDGNYEILKYLPRYIEWSADLSSRLQQIQEILLKMIMLVGETNATAIGAEVEGAPESGYALRIRMSTPLAKVRRKMQYWDPAIKNAFHAALALEKLNGIHSIEPERPTLEWPDGLPEDQREIVEIAVMKKGHGLASLRTVVAEANPNLEGEALETELAEIKSDQAEQDSRTTAGGSFFGEPSEPAEDAVSEDG